jgi:hypothetical protein
MPLQEPYATRVKQIGQCLIQLESSNPGIVRMRATYDPLVITTVVERLKSLGFRKRFFQTAQQFLYDSFLSYQAAVETCLPYSILAGPRNPEGHTHCWAGVGVYMGWCGPLAMNNFFERKIGGLNGAVLIINIEPFYDRIQDLLEPIAEVPVRDGSSFDRAIVLEGAILGLAAIVEHEYLNEHYPGYQIQKQVLTEHDGKSFDVVDFTTGDGKNKRLYFALSGFKTG